VEEGAHADGLLFGQDPHQIMYYVSGVVGLIGILLAAILHGPRGWQGLFLGGRTEAARCRMDAVARLFGPIPRWAEDKWYVDEFYIAVFQTPLRVFAHLFHLFDKFVIDGIVDGVAKLPGALASALRPSQSGQLQGYAAGMAGGIVVLLIVVLIVLGGAS
jgi:NADH-quinone oxidoreductase subunit L